MILYSTDNCPRCSLLKKLLNEKNIPYEIHSDEKEMESKGILTVPQIEINGMLMSFTEAYAYVKGL